MVTLYVREPGMLMRDAKGDWTATSGGLVVLRSAIKVVALGIYPQPVISQVQGLQNRVLRQPPMPLVSGTVGHLPDMKNPNRLGWFRISYAHIRVINVPQISLCVGPSLWATLMMAASGATDHHWIR